MSYCSGGQQAELPRAPRRRGRGGGFGPGHPLRGQQPTGTRAVDQGRLRLWWVLFLSFIFIHPNLRFFFSHVIFFYQMTKKKHPVDQGWLRLW